ncbi:MAG: hypothetical protein HKO59_18130 [Phycisphaerales bacterium]|nr:hypothetical protein [Phycisphaerales bacterium]NNM27856.1 hypothetical protein [Phycisphaerales bacterium]
MAEAEARRQRLAELLDLAQNYKRWTRKELARTLGRDPTKLIPGSGIPKLDLVVDLSGVLDWPVDDVVAYLWGQKTEIEAGPADDFETLDQAARAAHRAGEYREMIDHARAAFRAAISAEQRARACNREAGGWDGLGRYSHVLEAVKRGLRQSPVAPEYQRMLQSNLAAAYYSLWSLVEARAIAFELLAHYQDQPPKTTRERKNEAFAHYVLGHTFRRQISREPADAAAALAARARPHLERGRDLYAALAEELGDESLAGIASTCEGGLLEIDATVGLVDTDEALARIADRLDGVADTSELAGDVLESYGWWCIFGCNIALRCLHNERELQQHMAVFTNKADEIAERLDNWSMRERVFTMEHSRWERAVGCTGFDIPRIVDEEEVRVITGAMARFPTFRETGWQILRSAKVIRAN